MASLFPKTDAKIVDETGRPTRWFRDFITNLEEVLAQALFKADSAFRDIKGSGTDDTVESVLKAGMIMLWPTVTAPAGWFLCDGTAISRSTYAVLFTAIGTTYGAGDGSTTFNIPNLTDRYAVGVGVVALGGTAGANTVDISHTHAAGTLAAASAGAHTHSADGTLATAVPSATVAVQSGTGTTVSTDTHTHDVTGNTSSDGAHTHTISGATASGGTTTLDNRPASLALNTIIKY